MAKKKLSDIERSTDEYDIKSKQRLINNMERKFKKLFGAALYQFETLMRTEIEKNPELHKEFKSELFRIGNRIIQNMKKELECYNCTYIPFRLEMKGPDFNEN